MVEGYLTRPDEAIAKLGPIDDPMIGVFVHWTYAPHTVDGVVGKDNPLLLASNFSGTWPGLVALLEHRGLAGERRPRRPRASGPTPPTGPPTPASWSGSTSGARPAGSTTTTDEIRTAPAPSGPKRSRSPGESLDGIRRRRVLALMLGDTSMGMINGYFGPATALPDRLQRAQGRPGLAHRAHAVDRRRSESTMHSNSSRTGASRSTGSEADAEDFTPAATREQLRGYLAVLDLLEEFQADCLGWQYQLGLLKLLPPSDFAEGLLNSHAGPKGTAAS